MAPNGLVLFSLAARSLIEIRWRLLEIVVLVVYALARGDKRVDALPSTLGFFIVVFS